MNVRKDRQSTIIRLIEEESISTQDELILKLREHGYDVTQATISRDIKELKLIKKIGSGGKSVYSVNNADPDTSLSKFNTILESAVQSVDYAQNIGVIKTHVGMANAVCASLDAMNWDGMVGTLAGDDTIFIVFRDLENAKNFCESIQHMIRF